MLTVDYWTQTIHVPVWAIILYVGFTTWIIRSLIKGKQ